MNCTSKKYDNICSNHFIGGKKFDSVLNPSHVPAISNSLVTPKAKDMHDLNRYGNGNLAFILKHKVLRNYSFLCMNARFRKHRIGDEILTRSTYNMPMHTDDPYTEENVKQYHWWYQH